MLPSIPQLPFQPTSFRSPLLLRLRRPVILPVPVLLSTSYMHTYNTVPDALGCSHGEPLHDCITLLLLHDCIFMVLNLASAEVPRIPYAAYWETCRQAVLLSRSTLEFAGARVGERRETDRERVSF